MLLRALSSYVLETCRNGCCTTFSLSTPKVNPFHFKLCLLSLISQAPQWAIHLLATLLRGTIWLLLGSTTAPYPGWTGLAPSSPHKCCRCDAYPGVPGLQPAGGPWLLPGHNVGFCSFPSPEPQGISAELLPSHRQPALYLHLHHLFKPKETLIRSFKLQLSHMIRSQIQPFWFCVASSTSDFHMLYFCNVTHVPFLYFLSSTFFPVIWGKALQPGLVLFTKASYIYFLHLI